MANTFQYFRYNDYSYRVEFDTAGNPVCAAILRPDGSWYEINFGWDIIMMNNPPISEDEAYALADRQRKQW